MSAQHTPHETHPAPRPPIPTWLRYSLLAFSVICALLLLADSLVHRHVEHALERWWGFYGMFGFLACVALVEAAKLLRHLLMRPRNYYEDKD